MFLSSKMLLGASVAAAAFATFLPSTASAQQSREIWFENACRHPIRFLVNHADGWRNWHPHGWWTFRAYQSPTRLLVSDAAIFQRDDHDLYFYAETTNGANLQWEGDNRQPYNGTHYNFVKANVSIQYGRMNVRITCD